MSRSTDKEAASPHALSTCLNPKQAEQQQTEFSEPRSDVPLMSVSLANQSKRTKSYMSGPMSEAELERLSVRLNALALIDRDFLSIDKIAATCHLSKSSLMTDYMGFNDQCNYDAIYKCDDLEAALFDKTEFVKTLQIKMTKLLKYKAFVRQKAINSEPNPDECNMDTLDAITTCLSALKFQTPVIYIKKLSAYASQNADRANEVEFLESLFDLNRKLFKYRKYPNHLNDILHENYVDADYLLFE